MTFALAMLMVGGFLYPQETRAVNFDATGIELHTEIEINGQRDNLIRLVKGQSQKVNFTVIVTPTKLTSKDFGNPEYLAFNTDTMDFNTATHGRRPIQGAGVGVEIAGEGNTCGIKGISSALPLTDNSNYLTCNYPGGKQLVSSNTLNLNQEYRFNFSLSGSSVSALKLDRPCVRGGQTTGCFTVVPFLNIEVALGPDSNIAFNAAAKDIYVQLFNSQSELDAAVQSGQRPSDVPNYGGATGTASTSRSGSALLGFINQILGMLIGLIQEFIFLIFYWLIAPLIQAVLSIRTYTDGFAGVIYPGWVVVRNVSNIFFIVALIAIGMATLFRLESYQYRHLLVQLIIAALLVNFSLVIAQAILGVADTVQNQFLPNNVEVIRALAKDMMLNYRSAVYDGFFNFAQKGYFATTIQPLFYLSLALGSFLVFLAIAAFLVIRIVMLWILLMVSPMAYAAGVLPAMAKYRSEWWSTFLKYAFFTPIMAFFLNMAAVISTAQQKNPVLQRVLSDPTVLGTDSSFAGFVFKVSSNIILLVFLVIALKVAEQAGVYGASAITGLAKKGMFAPFSLAGKGAGGVTSALGRWYAKQTALNVRNAEEQGKKKTAAMWRAAMLLNPKVAKKAWEDRSRDKEMEAYGEAYGVGRDTLNRIMPTEYQWGKIFKGDFRQGLGQKTYYGRIGHANMIAHKRSEWEKANLSAQEKAQAMQGAHHPDEVEALSYIIADGRHEDDFTLFDTPELREKIEKMKDTMAQQKLLQLQELRANGDEAYKDKTDAELEAEAKAFGEQEAQGYFDKVEWGDVLYQKLRHGGATHEDAIERIRHLQEYYESQQKTRGIGMVVQDVDGQHRLATDLSVYAKMNNKELLNNLFKLGIFKVDENDVDQETGNLKDGVTSIKFEMLDRKTGKSLGTKTISNYQDLQAAIADTKAKYNNWYDHAWKRADLGYAIAGARAWKLDAQTRHRRGKGEGWAMDFEPAQNKIQTQREGYVGLNSFGERAEAEKPDTHLSSMAKSRSAQSRGPEDAGIVIRHDGKHDFKWNDLALNMRTNIKLTQTLIEQAKLTSEELDMMVKTINADENLRRVVNLRDENGNLRDVRFEDLVAPQRPSHEKKAAPAT